MVTFGCIFRCVVPNTTPRKILEVGETEPMDPARHNGRGRGLWKCRGSHASSPMKHPCGCASQWPMAQGLGLPGPAHCVWTGHTRSTILPLTLSCRKRFPRARPTSVKDDCGAKVTTFDKAQQEHGSAQGHKDLRGRHMGGRIQFCHCQHHCQQAVDKTHLHVGYLGSILGGGGGGGGVP